MIMDIIHTVLQTNALHDTKQFYRDILGMPIHQETAHSFHIQFGKSTITFCDKDVADAPYYHFACDIPANQFEEAKAWLQARLPLLTENGEDEVTFSFSVAQSCYFEDPSGNIVEFIARKYDNEKSDVPFSTASIQRLSEMSLVVPDAVEVATQLQPHQLVERSDDVVTNDTLSFISDQQSSVYLLLTAPKRKWLFSPKRSHVFPIRITLGNGKVLGVNDEQAFFIN